MGMEYAGARLWIWICVVAVFIIRSTASLQAIQSNLGIRQISRCVGDNNCNASSGSAGSWRHNVSFTIEHHGAQFLVFRFAYLRLPRGATLVVRDTSGKANDQGTLRFKGGDTKDDRRRDTTFYTRPIHSRRAVIEYTVPLAPADDEHSDGEVGDYGFHIDQYRFAARGIFRGNWNKTTQKKNKKRRRRRRRGLSNDQDEYDYETNGSVADDTSTDPHHDPAADQDDPLPEFFDNLTGDGDAETLIGNDDDGGANAYDSDDATSVADQCVTSADESARVACVRYNAQVFSKARAIARLLVHKPTGSIFCTGFLLGCEGHVMTNHHCVSGDSDADATFIEFLAQGKQCQDTCEQPMGCPGVIEATSSEIVAFSPTNELDFTLLRPRMRDPQARQDLTSKYGFLTLRTRGATQHERIFIPQHPAGYGKRVALKHGSSYGSVMVQNASGRCNPRLESLAYMLDTRGGSSGSPVIAYDDTTVIGVHYCGGCMNSAIPSDRIVEHLLASSSLPLCAQA